MPTTQTQGQDGDGGTQTTLLKEMPFSQSFVGVMLDLSSGLVLEADFSVDTTYPVKKAQIDQISFGKPKIIRLHPEVAVLEAAV